VPGQALYIGDILVAVATFQVVLAVRRRRTTVRELGRALFAAPLVLLLALALLAWSILRVAAGLDDVLGGPLIALRDLAPYAYALTALLGFVLPAAEGPVQRRVIYAALGAHAAWVLLGPRLPGWPWAHPLLGGASVLTTRPDFDSAVFGIGVALVLHDLLFRSRSPWRAPQWAVLVLGITSAYGLATLQTRAGLLSSLIGVGAVGTVWVRSGAAHRTRRPSGRRLGLVIVAMVAAGAALLVSPPGQRLVDGITGSDRQAAGTVQVRRDTWSGVVEYVAASPWRTAVGVGFGPDFIEASGTSYALEGTEYKGVRSPHDYVVGTFARVGVAGALLAAFMLLAGFAAAMRALVAFRGTTTTLASLVLLTLPVVALLGVVLESPFGAIPYFWAVGQVARSLADRPRPSMDGVSSAAG
jgi:hypothetical protein